MRNRLIALPLVALASLLSASIALAGGSAVVTFKDGPPEPVVGEETTIDLTVLQHGVTPVSWPSLSVIATDAKSGTVLQTKAVASGPEGSYFASFVFPTAGEWTLTFESGELEMMGAVGMSVASPASAAQASGAVAAAPESDPIPTAFLVIAAIAAAGLLLAFAARALSSRGVVRDSQVSART